MLSDGTRKLPPAALGGAERQAPGQSAVEEARLAGDEVDELAIEQRQRSQLREACRVRCGGGEGVLENGLHRVALRLAEAEHVLHPLGAVLARSRREHRRRRPSPRRRVEEPRLLLRNLEAEALTAEGDRLFGQ